MSGTRSAAAKAAAAKDAAPASLPPTPPAESSGSKRKGPPPAAPSVKAAQILKDRFLGVFRLPLDRLQQSLTVRQINPRNVKKLADSMKQDGFWQDRGALSVYFREVTKAPADFSEDDAKVAGVAYAFDGNHRLAAMTKIVADDDKQTVIPVDGIPCYCYLEIEDPQLKRVVSDGYNEITGTIGVRTIYDRIFYFRELYEGASLLRPGNGVRIKDLKAPYQQAGRRPPSDSTLGTWLKLVKGMKGMGLVALKNLAETEDTSLDLEILTVDFLGGKLFCELEELEQRFVLEILARWKSFNTTSRYKPKEHQAGILQTAKRAALWYAKLGKIIPQEEWTEDLATEADTIAFRKPSSWTFHASFLDGLDKEVSDTVGSLPGPGTQLDDWIVDTILSQQPKKITKAIEKDPDLREHYQRFIAKLQEAKSAVALKKLQQIPSPKKSTNGKKKRRKGGAGGREDGDDDDDEEEEEEEDEDESQEEEEENDEEEGLENKGLVCRHCTPNSASRYTCTVCGIKHKSYCTKAKKLKPEPCRDMKCSDCDDSKGSTVGTKRPAGGAAGESSRKRSTGGANQGAPAKMPGAGDSDQIASRRAECTHVSRKILLSSKVADSDLEDHLEPNATNMLVMLNPGTEKSLLGTTQATLERVRHLVRAIVTSKTLHRNGTLAVHVPQPIAENFLKWTEAMTQAGANLEVEAHPMCVEFTSKGGGRPGASSGPRHLTGRVDHYIIGHQTGNGGAAPSFTCNTTVTSADPVGTAASSGPCTNLMKDVPFESAKNVFPRRLISFLVMRFTKQGDRVMSNSGDRDQVLEVALAAGRKVTVFASEVANADDLNVRVEAAFQRAWTDGLFKNTGGGLQGAGKVIGAGSLPANVPRDTTLRGVHQTIDDVRGEMEEDGDEPSEAAFTQAATRVALSLGYDLREDDSGGPPRLYTVRGKRYDIGGNDLPVWGKMEIHNSHGDAEASIVADDQGIQLVRVADHADLQSMLARDQESLRDGASLYCRVAPSCPARYVSFETDGAGVHHEIVSDVRKNLKKSGVDMWRDPEGNLTSVVKLVVWKTINKSNDGEMVLCMPGSRGVNEGGASDNASGAAEDGPEMTTTGGDAEGGATGGGVAED